MSSHNDCRFSIDHWGVCGMLTVGDDADRKRVRESLLTNGSTPVVGSRAGRGRILSVRTA